MSRTYEQLEPVISALDERIKTNLDAYPTDTAEGEIASFSDGADNVPVKSLVVGIEPVQDLHGYDTPWPAGGGVNKLDVSYTESITLSKTFNFSRPLPAGDYVFSFVDADTKMEVASYQLAYYKDTSASYTYYAVSPSTKNRVIHATEPCSKIALYSNNAYTESSGFTTVFTGLQLQSGETVTSWQPYSNICPITGWTGANVTVSPTNNAEDGETIDITFPTEAGTVYGGSLDITNGVLTVDRASMTVASAGLNGMANGMQIVSATPSDKAYGVDNVMSNLFATGTSGAYTVNGNTSNVRVDFRIPMTDLGITESDSSSVRQGAVNEWLANHSTQLVYGITPITYQLTPTEVTTLLGQNNIWADTGDTNVVYRADTSAYISKKIAEAISALS